MLLLVSCFYEGDTVLYNIWSKETLFHLSIPLLVRARLVVTIYFVLFSDCDDAYMS